MMWDRAFIEVFVAARAPERCNQRVLEETP
jgi:hypothetical protein